MSCKRPRFFHVCVFLGCSLQRRGITVFWGSGRLQRTRGRLQCPRYCSCLRQSGLYDTGQRSCSCSGCLEGNWNREGPNFRRDNSRVQAGGEPAREGAVHLPHHLTRTGRFSSACQACARRGEGAPLALLRGRRLGPILPAPNSPPTEFQPPGSAPPSAFNRLVSASGIALEPQTHLPMARVSTLLYVDPT